MSEDNLYDDRAWQLYTAACISYFLALVGVSLRTYVRRYIIGKLSLDDYMILVALASNSVYFSLTLVILHYGIGKHQLALPPHEVEQAVKYFFFCEWIYVLTMTLTRVAIALFYLRLAISRVQRWIVYVILYGSLVWGLAYMILAIVQCLPVSYYWLRYTPQSPTSLNYDPTSGPPPQGHCLSQGLTIAGLYIYSASGVLCDWILGLLPVAMLWKVKMPTGTRLMLAALLGCGAIASTCTIVRLAYVYYIADLGDFLWNVMGVSIWSSMEPGFALFAAGLATLRPLLRKLFPSRFQNLQICSDITSFADIEQTDGTTELKDSIMSELPPPPKRPNIYQRPSLPTDLGHNELYRNAGLQTYDEVSIISGDSRSLVIQLDGVSPGSLHEPQSASPRLEQRRESFFSSNPTPPVLEPGRAVSFNMTPPLPMDPTWSSVKDPSLERERSRSIGASLTSHPTEPPSTVIKHLPRGLSMHRRAESLASSRPAKDRERIKNSRKSWKGLSNVLDGTIIEEEERSESARAKHRSRIRTSAPTFVRPAPWSDVLPPSETSLALALAPKTRLSLGLSTERGESSRASAGSSTL